MNMESKNLLLRGLKNFTELIKLIFSDPNSPKVSYILQSVILLKSKFEKNFNMKIINDKVCKM